MTDWKNMSRSQWDALTDEQREDWDEEASREFALAVAGVVGVVNPQLAEHVTPDDDVDYGGRLGRYPARIRLTAVGTVQLQVECPCDVDTVLNLDSPFRSVDGSGDVAPHISVGGPRRAFEALPAHVKKAAVAGMPMHHVTMLTFGLMNGIVAFTDLTPYEGAAPLTDVSNALRFVSTLAHLINEGSN